MTKTIKKLKELNLTWSRTPNFDNAKVERILCSVSPKLRQYMDRTNKEWLYTHANQGLFFGGIIKEPEYESESQYWKEADNIGRYEMFPSSFYNNWEINLRSMGHSTKTISFLFSHQDAKHFMRNFSKKHHTTKSYLAKIMLVWYNKKHIARLINQEKITIYNKTMINTQNTNFYREKNFKGKNEEVISCFLGQNYKSGNNSNKSISFFENKIYSYQTLIGMITSSNDITISLKKYSRTTSTMQNQLYKLAQAEMYNIVTTNTVIKNYEKLY